MDNYVPNQVICLATKRQMSIEAQKHGLLFDAHQNTMLRFISKGCPFGYHAVIDKKNVRAVIFDGYEKGIEAYYSVKNTNTGHALIYRGFYVAVYAIDNGLLLIASDAFMSYELDEHPFEMGFDILEDIVCNSEMEYNFNPEWSDELVVNGNTYFDNHYAVRCWVETLHSVGYIVFDMWRG